VSPHQFSKNAYTAGIETHQIDGVSVKIYRMEKTLADCFKFRNKIGMDIVLESLKLYRDRKKFNLAGLIKYGEICRVEEAMKPYLEALV
jgi:predicted transcriptional regulator of viral defense system